MKKEQEKEMEGQPLKQTSSGILPGEGQGKPILWIVVPCYNEEEVLPITAPMFLEEIETLTDAGKISDRSRVLFVNDGSKDRTWEIIRQLAAENPHYIGISQSRNRGHQNAVLAGLMEAKDVCDITISIDCDGQDDINAMGAMVDEYLKGAEVVYGVRSSRQTDTWFKGTTAQSFYKLMNRMGAEVVYNHADYRLISARVLQSFADFQEVNIFLRGLVPLVGCNRRHHESFCETHLDHHGIWHGRERHRFYRYHLGHRYGLPWEDHRRLGLDGVHHLFPRRYSDALARRHRRVYRQNLS